MILKSTVFAVFLVDPGFYLPLLPRLEFMKECKTFHQILHVEPIFTGITCLEIMFYGFQVDFQGLDMDFQDKSRVVCCNGPLEIHKTLFPVDMFCGLGLEQTGDKRACEWLLKTIKGGGAHFETLKAVPDSPF